MAVIKNGVGYFAVCNHPDHRLTFPAAIDAATMTGAIQKARARGWHVSILNKWANCPDCHSLFGLDSGKHTNNRTD
jgi:hypothetical protein